MTIILSCACGALAIALAVAARSAYLWRREAVIANIKLQRAAAESYEYIAKAETLIRGLEQQRLRYGFAAVQVESNNDQCN